MLKDLQVVKTIKNVDRISSIDIFRSIAILSVVIYHYKEWLPYGYLGVSLFFVISGFLIGTILLKEYNTSGTIHYFRFVISRGFKIWPSYYAFLIFGNIVAYYLYHSSHPDYIIPLNDMPRYLFFYKNFVGTQYHWCFEHVWSLCVEEHFYLVFPLLFVFISLFKWKQYSQKTILFTHLIIVILLSILMRIILLRYFAGSINVYECTFVRIHELSFGVLLSLLFMYYKENLRQMKRLYWLFIVGLILFCAAVFCDYSLQSKSYSTYVFPVIIPISFSLMLIGVYFVDCTKWIQLRVIAYYSYNWYLWHTIFVLFIIKHINHSVVGFIVYILTTFLMAVLTTTFIEEKFLSKRTTFIHQLFNKHKST